jgi:response regulator RpfG family c-di-GMP phosphodiesterase
MDPLLLAQRNSIYKSAINVLVVDDFPPILETIREYFQGFGIYKMVTASSTGEAEKILSGNDIRFHSCLFDLGMKDVENNEFYLLDKYANKIPFIVISYRKDLETGFACKSRGARAILAKGSCDFLKNLVAQVNKLALLNLICPQYMEGRMDILCKLVEVLFEKKPLHVNDWAMEANITDRQLRREWAEELGVCAKHSLCVFHIFSHAFNFRGPLNIHRMSVNSIFLT